MCVCVDGLHHRARHGRRPPHIRALYGFIIYTDVWTGCIDLSFRSLLARGAFTLLAAFGVRRFRREAAQVEQVLHVVARDVGIGQSRHAQNVALPRYGPCKPSINTTHTHTLIKKCHPNWLDSRQGSGVPTALKGI